MLDIYVRIETIDRTGFQGREHLPTSDMVGQFVRVIHFEEVQAADDSGGDGRYAHPAGQMFSGYLVDANGNDVEDGEVQVMGHEIESSENVPTLFGQQEG